MPGEFARSCIDMTGRLYAELLRGGEGGSALLPTVYQLQCRTSEKMTLPNEGDWKELAAWIKHVVASYEPRAYLRRVTCEGDGFCVVVSNPVLRLTHDSFLGAGRASILASYLWTGTADQPRLRSAHLYQIFTYVKNLELCAPLPAGRHRRPRRGRGHDHHRL